MFKLKFLPATIGDSIWVSYGDPSSPNLILIDGGTAGTRNHIQDGILDLPEDQRRFELIVVSHIDKDHIGGILTMLERDEVSFKVDDFWFNSFKHLPQDLLSVAQGERLSDVLKQSGSIPWNKAFNNKAVVIPDHGDLPQITLPGGMKLTLLSPTIETLGELAEKWQDEVLGEGLQPGGELSETDEEPNFDDMLLSSALPDVESLAETDFDSDKGAANGSSIAFLAEFEGKRVLFAADAHVPVLLESLERLSPGKKLDVDLFKISHHGSKKTTSRELIEKLNCKRFVFSTNGSIFGHPDHEAVARVLMGAGDDLELAFNYRSIRNEIWDRDEMKADFGYDTLFPRRSDPGIEIEL